MFAAIPFPSISPELFSISIGGFEFALRWYALGYVAGILIARWLILITLRRAPLWPQGQAPLTTDQFENLVTWLILGIIIGGRLGFVLFYQPSFYLQNPMEILKVWNGGMAFHGGFLGVVVAGVVFCIRTKVAILPLADAIAMSAPWGIGLVRVTNFINGELWGRETTVPWGVIFPGPEAQRCVDAVQNLCARHPSQLYEALGEGLILGLLLLYLTFRTDALKRTGLVLGLFVGGYGLTRFLVEFVRQPDIDFQSPSNPIGFALQFGPNLGLTMGQILSLPMIAFGVWAIVFSRGKAFK
ncbi:MAG: prolipoprotein diacylglyceryl transferase [Pseudomonadota bacterium]